VRHVRGQQRHGLARRLVPVPVEVEADRAVVKDDQRPRVVGVRGVGVIDEVGVEDLGDPRYGGPPRDQMRAGWARHANNVQDGRPPPARM
jgi:hypothetical protein